jgi:c-di-GMP-binding flagellar brake protein YcgR
VPLLADVTYEAAGKLFSSLLFSLSGRGAFIGTPEPLPAGKDLQLVFSVPGLGNSFAASGTVIYEHEYPENADRGMGVRFNAMAPGDQERLDRFVAEYGTGG